MARGVCKTVEERKIVVSFSIPYSILKQIEEESAATDRNRSQIVCEILEDYFGKEG